MPVWSLGGCLVSQAACLLRTGPCSPPSPWVDLVLQRVPSSPKADTSAFWLAGGCWEYSWEGMQWGLGFGRLGQTQHGACCALTATAITYQAGSLALTL